MKRLLGLRDFPAKSPPEKLAILGSAERVKALDAITTTTMPPKKKEIKKGVVLEISERKLLSPKLLRSHPLVYIGSGTDIEYPLALGGRIIILVDPILQNPQAQEELVTKLKHVSPRAVSITGNQIAFKFDFGEGEENVTVDLLSKPYPYSEAARTEADYIIPEETGVVVLFASRGPEGSIAIDESIRNKLTEGGLIIEEHKIIKKDGAVEELGS